MYKEKKVKYYQIRASLFWSVFIVVGLLFFIMSFDLFKNRNVKAEDIGESEHIETVHVEYGSISSKLKNTEECYLCGSHANSLMGYYRKFDTVGIIGLNEWYVLDLRLKEYDSNGNPTKASSGMSTSFGNISGVDYHLDAVPSRGMSSITLESANGFFDETIVKKNLCQGCLDKVTETLEGNFEEGKEDYLPFCLVDFKTLDIYPVQKMKRSYSVRDYWIELDYDDSEIELDAYYLPGNV